MRTIKKAYCRTFQKVFHLAIPFLPYRNPEIINSVEKLPEILKKENCHHLLIITDTGIIRLGLLKPLLKTLEQAGIFFTIYDKTVANPTTANVDEALSLYHEYHCSGILGFGGGSSIDCAKAVGARIARPDKTLGQMKGILKVLKRLPLLIAVPTTAGTGSETTLAAVITDAKTRHKYAVNDFPLIPMYAVLDPKDTFSLPPFLTATTGMDALTHAVEAFIGNSTTRQTRSEAIRAVRLIFKNLPAAYADGHNLEARQNMLYASYLAGCAFTKSYVGYVHAIAHSLGGKYDIPHGLANAIILPFVLEAYGTAIHQKLHTLAVAAELCPKETPAAEAASLFIQAVKDMKKQFGIGDTVDALQEKDIPQLARHADAEANPLYPVPVLMNAFELQKLYRVLLKTELPKSRTLTKEEINAKIEAQRRFFAEGKTLTVDYRLEALQKLQSCIQNYEKEINLALKNDLGKSGFESYMCETGMTLSEISYMLKHTRRFAREQTVLTPLAQFASRSYKKPSPYGVTLIMSPWNYPFMLTMEPLVDAIAAGNTAIVKPSAYSPHTSAIIEKIISECFPPEYVTVVTGGRAENTCLLKAHFDYIFFTGSPSVGRLVMEEASKHLTPVTLELGGKSPCIIDATADISLAAKRIVFGKFLNCGQTCVAPDYIYCDASIKNKLIQELARQIRSQFGNAPLDNPDYGKIINEKHFKRLCRLIDPAKTVIGGNTDALTHQISPTVMDHITFDDPVMQEEIFGPILPILTYETIEQAIQTINNRPHPLALYLFSSDKQTIDAVTSRCSFGGGCINDTIIHLATSNMGFGGFGESGMGSYHGLDGFRTFSHYKSIVDKKTWLDLPMRYQPYCRIYDFLIHIFLR